MCGFHAGLLVSSSLMAKLPFVRLDADEVIFLALLQERDALTHQRISDDHPGLRFSVIFGSIKGSHDGVEIIAIDTLHEPTKGL